MPGARRTSTLKFFFISLGIAVVLFSISIPFYLASRAMESARQIGKDINDVFHFTPEVTVNNKTVLQQETPILELATVSQKFNHQFEWSEVFLKSTKTIIINGSFEAKAGFDLRKKFEIRITDDRALVILPEPELLSLQPTGDMKFEGYNGLWNYLTDESRSKALNAFHADAKKQAEKATYANAKMNAEVQLRKILESHGFEVEIRYREPVSRNL
jgi:hypothetical protein